MLSAARVPLCGMSASRSIATRTAHPYCFREFSLRVSRPTFLGCLCGLAASLAGGINACSTSICLLASGKNARGGSSIERRNRLRIGWAVVAQGGPTRSNLRAGLPGSEPIKILWPCHCSGRAIPYFAEFAAPVFTTPPPCAIPLFPGMIAPVLTRKYTSPRKIINSSPPHSESCFNSLGDNCLLRFMLLTFRCCATCPPSPALMRELTPLRRTLGEQSRQNFALGPHAYASGRHELMAKIGKEIES